MMVSGPSSGRRQFVKIEREAAPAPAPVGREALERIAQLYAVEKALRGRSAAERSAGTQAHARPLAAALKQWFEAKLDRLAQKSDTAKALRYALRHWDGLTLYLDDGRIEMDTNAVERAMRPIKLNAKNALFAGCDEGASYYPSAYLPIIQGISDWHRKATDCGAIACERHLGARLVA